MRTRNVAVLLTLALLASALAVEWPWGADPAAVTASGHATSPASSPPVVAVPYERREQSASQPSASSYRYELDFHNEFMQGGGDGTGGMVLGFTAQLVLSPLTSDATGRSEELRLEDIVPVTHHEARNWLSSDEAASIKRTLSTPFYPTYATDGRLTALRFEARQDSMTENMLRYVALALQRVRPAGASARWQAEELDTTGEVLVQYQQEGRVLTKKKLRYLRVLDETGFVEPRENELEVRATATFELGDGAENPTLKRLHVEDDIRISLDQQHLDNHTEFSLELVGRDAVNLALARWSRVQNLASVALDRLPPVKKQDPMDEARRTLGSATSEDLKRAVEGLPQDDDGTRRQVLAKLEALLMLKPESAAEFAPMLRNDDAQKRGLVLSALTSASTDDAQATMRAFADDAQTPPGDRNTAYGLLGTLRTPNEETVRTVKEASADSSHPHRRTATLALGSLARNLAESDGDTDLFSELSTRLSRAPDDRERLLLIRALGNTADARLSELLAPYAIHGSIELRATACFALRLVATASATELLQHGLSDTDLTVRLSVLSALHYAKREACLQMIAAFLRKELDEDACVEALHLLLELGTAEALAMIAQVARSDAREKVRAQARDMLSHA